MLETQVLSDRQLWERLERAFGNFSDPMELVERRANELFADKRVIVWEGDPQTFQFSYVGRSAEEILGFPVQRWTSEATFWGDAVVHEEDRNEAIAFCALATGKCEDHDFVYRAYTADGRVVTLHDVVKVKRGPRGVAELLRGIMIEVPER